MNVKIYNAQNSIPPFLNGKKGHTNSDPWSEKRFKINRDFLDDFFIKNKEDRNWFAAN